MTVICPDVSEFQTPLTMQFQGRMLIMRVTFGAHYLDRHFLQNASVAKRLYEAGRIDGVILYVVYLGSATPDEQYAAAVKAVGPKPPAWLAGFMIDVETWRGQSYAIRGDHSRQINRLGGLLAGYMRTTRAVLIYGNRSDLAEVAPKRDPRFRVIVASYGSQLVHTQVRGAIGQQYTDGQARWPVPSIGGKALRRSSAPFGACDHNVFPGFASAKALVASMRPPAPARPTKPAKPARPKPVRLYNRSAVAASALVSSDRRTALFLTNDGHLDIHHDHRRTRLI